jgi:hypothetical protein
MIDITAILARDDYKCFRCGKDVTFSAHSVHHRILGNRKDNRPSNLITLCGSGTTGCHAAVHGIRSPGNRDYSRTQAQEEGFIVSRHRISAATLTVPVKHHRFGLVLLDDQGGQTIKAA